MVDVNGSKQSPISPTRVMNAGVKDRPKDALRRVSAAATKVWWPNLYFGSNELSESRETLRLMESLRIDVESEKETLIPRPDPDEDIVQL